MSVVSISDAAARVENDLLEMLTSRAQHAALTQSTSRTSTGNTRSISAIRVDLERPQWSTINFMKMSQ
jgi:hypothetical protein